MLPAEAQGPASGTRRADHPEDDAAGVVTFELGGCEYALPLSMVVEVTVCRTPTAVPGADPEIVGIVPMRGRMLTIVDPRGRLGLPRERRGTDATIVVVRVEDEWFGIEVDKVRKVDRIDTHDPGPVRVLDAEALLRERR